MEITEETLKKIIEETQTQLGHADDATVKKIVIETVRRLSAEPENFGTAFHEKTEGRMIVTSFGKNQPGVISSISQTLSDCNCDILDVSQKIMQDFFTLIMLVDIQNAVCPFGIIKSRLAETSAKLGIRILAQHEDVFKAMHRI